jgi:hypothetical protein
MALVALVGAAVAMVGLAQSAQAADKNATGTWKWTQQMGRRGGQDGNNNQQQGQGREFTLKLKQDGEKVTGTLMAPAGGRRGGQDGQGGQGNQNAQGRETEIKNGKITADGTLSFEVTRQGRGGNEMTTTYKGKLDGDTIKGTMSFETQNGAQERPWEAKRATEDKKAA